MAAGRRWPTVIMTVEPLKRREIGKDAEKYIIETLAKGNAVCQELALRTSNPRAIWTWARFDLAEHASQLQFGGVFTREDTTEIYESLIDFAANHLRQGEVLVVLNQLARPSDPFLQNKSSFFVWENRVNFFVRGPETKIEDVDLCFREKRGYPCVAFLSRVPDLKMVNGAHLPISDVIALVEGMTHLIVGIFDEESYVVLEVA